MSREVSDLFLKLHALNYYAVVPQSSDKALRHRWGIDMDATSWTLYSNGSRPIPSTVLRSLVVAAVDHLPGKPPGLLDEAEGQLLEMAFPSFWQRLDAQISAATSGPSLARSRIRTWAALRTFLADNRNAVDAAASEILPPAGAERWVDPMHSLDVATPRLVLPANGRFTLTLPAMSEGAYLLWLYEVRDLGARVAEEGPPPLELIRWASSPMSVEAITQAGSHAIVLRNIGVSADKGDFILRAIASPAERPARFDPDAASGPRRVDFPGTATFLQRLRRELAGQKSEPFDSAGRIVIASLVYTVR